MYVKRIATGLLGLTLATGVGLTAGLTSELAGAQAAHAASAKGGPITRSEVLTRAIDWYNQRSNIPYNQGATFPDLNGTTYRTDCSGYVSMALHISPSGGGAPDTDSLATSSFTSLLDSTPTSSTDLRPGDILDDTAGPHADHHVVLFAGWESDHVHFTYYSFGSTPIAHGTTTFSASTLSGHPMSDYKAYRYKNIVESSTSRAAPAMAYDNGDSTMNIYRWGSTGTAFTSPAVYTSGAYHLDNVGRRTATGDVNGDGKTDIVQAYQNADNTFSFHVFLDGNSSAGIWYTSGSFTLANVGGRLVVADFNGDGKAEPALIYNTSGKQTIYRWLSNGTAFTRTTDYTGTGSFDLNNVQDRVAAADVNGDGNADIVEAYQHDDNTFSFYTFLNGNDSQGIWYTSGTFTLANVANRMVLADFNGDGKAEPALIYNTSGKQTIYRWLSNGTAFTRTTDYTGTGSFDLNNVQDHVAAADINGDGNADIVEAYQTGNTFSYYTFLNGNDSQGTWYTSGPYTLANTADRLVLGNW